MQKNIQCLMPSRKEKISLPRMEEEFVSKMKGVISILQCVVNSQEIKASHAINLLEQVTVRTIKQK